MFRYSTEVAKKAIRVILRVEDGFRPKLVNNRIDDIVIQNRCAQAPRFLDLFGQNLELNVKPLNCCFGGSYFSFKTLAFKLQLKDVVA